MPKRNVRPLLASIRATIGPCVIFVERDALDFEADADICVWAPHEDQRDAVRSVQLRAGVARIGRAAAKVLEVRAVA